MFSRTSLPLIKIIRSIFRKHFIHTRNKGKKKNGLSGFSGFVCLSSRLPHHYRLSVQDCPSLLL